jgi:hypothetical protein
LLAHVTRTAAAMRLGRRQQRVDPAPALGSVVAQLALGEIA